MEAVDLETCLKEATDLGLTAKKLFKESKFEQALQERFKEIALLERAYNSTPESDEKNSEVAGCLGESYSSISKIWHKLNNDKKDVEYLQKSRDILKITFDAGRLPAFAYDTYLFVLRKLGQRAQIAKEKLPYAQDYVSVLDKAAHEKQSVYYRGRLARAEDMLPGARAMVVQLEDYIKSKEASQP